MIKNFRKKIVTVISLILIDMLSFYISFFVAYLLRTVLVLINSLPQGDTYPLLHLYWMPFIYILILLYEGFYTERNPFWDETKRISKVITIATILVFSIMSFLNLSQDVSKSFIILFWISALFIFPVFRFFGKRILYNIKIWNEPVLILGHNQLAIDTARLLEKNRYLGYEVIGFVGTDEKMIGKKVKTKLAEYEILGQIDDYQELSKKYNSDVLLIALFGIGAEKLSEMIANLQKYTRRILIIPEVKGIAMQNAKLLHMYTQEIFLMEINNNLKKVINRTVKKVFDYILAIILIPLLLPILAILAILIKIDSRGPLFFIQDRMGYKGKNFKCIKFRTMHVNGDEILKKYLEENPEAREEYRVYKKLRTYDPRVTKMGQFFRRTSLDELAQIFNVFKGEMSFVGPRPYIVQEKEDMGKYTDIILESEPGITGLWQVSGRNNLTFERRVKLDVWYVLNWSLWLDISILIKTIKVVVKREGAS